MLTTTTKKEKDWCEEGHEFFRNKSHRSCRIQYTLRTTLLRRIIIPARVNKKNKRWWWLLIPLVVVVVVVDVCC